MARNPVAAARTVAAPGPATEHLRRFEQGHTADIHVSYHNSALEYLAVSEQTQREVELADSVYPRAPYRRQMLQLIRDDHRSPSLRNASALPQA